MTKQIQVMVNIALLSLNNQYISIEGVFIWYVEISEVTIECIQEDKCKIKPGFENEV
jgi:hypothetical protein